MKYSVLALFFLVLATAFIAGCTQSPPPAAVPVPTAVVTQPAVTVTPQTSFNLGDHFFDKKYSWQDGNEVYSEEFVVPQGQPWGIKYDVTPLNDDLSKCWYEVTVSNINTNHSDSFGFGRSHSSEKSQIYPVYGYGPYKVEMRGNYVKVDMTAAKRNA